MSMTKKDFEGVAAALNRALWEPDSDPLTVTRCALSIAEYCREANQSFSMDRFRLRVFADNETHVPFWRKDERAV